MEITNVKLSKITGGAALGALAVFLTFGSSADACSLAGGSGLRPATLADPSLRIGVPQLRDNPEAHRANTPASVEGLWQVTFSSDGAVVDMAFEVFHSDGTEMLNDITPPAEGNVCLGVWVQTGATSYKVTHPSWVFDAAGNLTGTAMFNATVTLGSADTFTGAYTLSYFDTRGTAGPVYTGTMTATRIQPNY
jgi:hypothetical protein